MFSRSSRAPAPPFLLPVLALVAYGIALEAQEQPPQQPTFRSEANYVRVDVFPTENGQPVRDLRVEDFELLEDGVRQRIEAFEHVDVRPGGPQTERVEPTSQREGNAMAADPRSRLFVLFLDTYHVGNDGSHNIRTPLVRLLDRLIGQDDLVGVMTPEMSAANLILARKTTTIEGLLTTSWDWGRREDITRRDPEEELYEACYSQPIADEMIFRRREKRSLDALRDLVVHLTGLRDERKAVLTISDGWKLYRPNPALARPLGAVPGTPEILVDPETGKLTTQDKSGPVQVTRYECDRDRLRLSQLDNDRDFRELLDAANRANASFYPIDPRGLPVFDTPIGSGQPLPPAADSAQLRARVGTLRTLAEGTDGIAVVNSNDIESGLRRVVSDLTSYYLLGYYSTNPKLDGKFRSITVRVKRPGVDVRARRGYRAATVSETRTARATGVPIGPAENTDLMDALGAVAAIKREARLRLHISSTLLPGGSDSAGQDPRGVAWVVGEIDQAVARTDEWNGGGAASIIVTTARGDAVMQTRVPIAAGSRTFVARLEDPSLGPGSYLARVQIRSGPAEPILEIGSFSIAAQVPAVGSPLLFRRGPFASLAFEPAADLRFRRNERLRIEVPIAQPDITPDATLLDRTGHPMPVPVVTSQRDDPRERVRWYVGELGLAPLGPGDYVIEWSAAAESGEQKVLTAFRVVP